MVERLWLRLVMDVIPGKLNALRVSLVKPVAYRRASVSLDRIITFKQLAPKVDRSE